MDLRRDEGVREEELNREQLVGVCNRHDTIQGIDTLVLLKAVLVF